MTRRYPLPSRLLSDRASVSPSNLMLAGHLYVSMGTDDAQRHAVAREMMARLGQSAHSAAVDRAELRQIEDDLRTSSSTWLQTTWRLGYNIGHVRIEYPDQSHDETIGGPFASYGEGHSAWSQTVGTPSDQVWPTLRLVTTASPEKISTSLRGSSVWILRSCDCNGTEMVWKYPNGTVEEFGHCSCPSPGSPNPSASPELYREPDAGDQQPIWHQRWGPRPNHKGGGNHHRPSRPRAAARHLHFDGFTGHGRYPFQFGPAPVPTRLRRGRGRRPAPRALHDPTPWG